MELKEIKEIIDLLKDTDVTELSIEKEGSRFKIKREKYLPAAVAAQPLNQAATHAAGSVESTAEKSASDHGLASVTSPIVGIFYTSSSPDNPPFAEVGSRVEKGQVLCIVEAMKLMNEIESDTAGIIRKVLPENGQPVEYGETLFLIEPLS